MLADLAASLLANSLASLAATAIERRDTEALSKALAAAWDKTSSAHGDEVAIGLDPKFIAEEGGPEIARLLLPGPGPDARRLAEAYVDSMGVAADLRPERAEDLVPVFETFLEQLTELLSANPRFRARLAEAAATRQWDVAPLTGLRAPPSDVSPSQWQQMARQTEAELTSRVASIFSPADVRVADGGADLVVRRRAGVAPLAIELKVWRASHRNLGNRVAEALSAAVLLRREFSSGVQLGLLAVFSPAAEFSAMVGLQSTSKRLGTLIRRSEQDAGFDRVIVGAWEAGARWYEVEAEGRLRPIADFRTAVGLLGARPSLTVARSDGDSADDSSLRPQPGSRQEPHPGVMLFA